MRTDEICWTDWEAGFNTKVPPRTNGIHSRPLRQLEMCLVKCLSAIAATPSASYTESTFIHWEQRLPIRIHMALYNPSTPHNPMLQHSHWWNSHREQFGVRGHFRGDWDGATYAPMRGRAAGSPAAPCLVLKCLVLNNTGQFQEHQNILISVNLTCQLLRYCTMFSLNHSMSHLK